MFILEITPYGLNIKLVGRMTVKILEDLKLNIDSKLSYLPIDPKVLIDATELIPLTQKVKYKYTEIYKTLVACGMSRSCVLYTSPSVQMQLRTICADVGFTEERYIDSASMSTSLSIRASREWLVLGTQPPRE